MTDKDAVRVETERLALPWRDDDVDAFGSGEYERVIVDAADEMVATIPTGLYDQEAARKDEYTRAIAEYIVRAVNEYATVRASALEEAAKIAGKHVGSVAPWVAADIRRAAIRTSPETEGP